jgi:hypothetical protein
MLSSTKTKQTLLQEKTSKRRCDDDLEAGPPATQISNNFEPSYTGSLSYNQLVIQSTQRLTEAILKGDCSGLMDFYSTEETIRTTRSSERGDLPTTIPMPGFRHQSSRLWNSFRSYKTLPKKLLGIYPL